MKHKNSTPISECIRVKGHGKKSSFATDFKLSDGNEMFKNHSNSSCSRVLERNDKNDINKQKLSKHDVVKTYSQKLANMKVVAADQRYKTCGQHQGTKSITNY